MCVCVRVCVYIIFLRFLRSRSAPSAEFSVDQTRHLMSFLTMLGPSPDWNVGLSGEDLCTKECGWVQRLVTDLIPWDAGTDGGITYEVISFHSSFPCPYFSNCTDQILAAANMRDNQMDNLGLSWNIPLTFYYRLAIIRTVSGSLINFIFTLLFYYTDNYKIKTTKKQWKLNLTDAKPNGTECVQSNQNTPSKVAI